MGGDITILFRFYLFEDIGVKGVGRTGAVIANKVLQVHIRNL
jgi:hypothetical protein